MFHAIHLRQGNGGGLWLEETKHEKPAPVLADWKEIAKALGGRLRPGRETGNVERCR